MPKAQDIMSFEEENTIKQFAIDSEFIEWFKAYAKENPALRLVSELPKFKATCKCKLFGWNKLSHSDQRRIFSDYERYHGISHHRKLCEAAVKEPAAGSFLPQGMPTECYSDNYQAVRNTDIKGYWFDVYDVETGEYVYSYQLSDMNPMESKVSMMDSSNVLFTTNQCPF